MEKKHRGVASEMRATLWLMEQGYEVFPNSSEYGPIDLIAVKGKDCIFVDVKTSNKDAKARFYLTKKQKELGVRFIFVHKNKVSWYVDRPKTRIYRNARKE